MKTRLRLFATILLGLTTAQFVAAEDVDTYYSWGNNADGLVSGAGNELGLTGSGGNYTMTAAGTDIWSNADHGAGAFDSTAAPRTGNFSAIVQVSVGLEGESLPANWGRTGIMARTDPADAASANFASIRRFGTDANAGANILQARDTLGGGTGRPNDGVNIEPTVGDDDSVPVWLSLHRAGNNLFTSWSADGVTWEAGSTRTASEAHLGPVHVGLMHQNHSSGAAAGNQSSTATFSGFAVSDFDASLGVFPHLPGFNLGVQDGKLSGQISATLAGLGSDPQAINWSVTSVGPVETKPGLLATTFLQGNPGTDWIASATQSGLAAHGGPYHAIGSLDNIAWSGNGSFGSLDTYPDALNLPEDPDNGGGGNQESYSVALAGQINIPAPGTYKFKDGIDDYTKLVIDGETLIDDNDWTGPSGADNNGSPIVEKTFAEAGWYDLEFRMAEGGGGDAGVLFWDYSADGVGTNADFPAGQTDPAGEGAIVPPENFRHFAGSPTGQISGSDIVDGIVMGDDGSMLDAAPGDLFIVDLDGSLFVSQVVPEPNSFALLGMAFMGLLGLRRRR